VDCDQLDFTLAHIHRRFDQIDKGVEEIHSRLDRLQRTMIHGMIAITGIILAGNSAAAVLLVTQA
jgi:hypothetical protein